MDWDQLSTSNASRDKARDEIASQVEAFLAQGGEIQELSNAGESEYSAAPAWARDSLV